MGNGCFYLYNNNSDRDLAYALEDVLVADLHMDFRHFDELSGSVIWLVLKNETHVWLYGCA